MLSKRDEQFQVSNAKYTEFLDSHSDLPFFLLPEKFSKCNSMSFVPRSWVIPRV